ncbi:hypothetical protein TNCV_1763791 [Trichonephila clavipes]|nr:hypothetical protein TNCV_1763791 [Trichonephila clavipes]
MPGRLFGARINQYAKPRDSPPQVQPPLPCAAATSHSRVAAYLATAVPKTSLSYRYLPPLHIIPIMDS